MHMNRDTAALHTATSSKGGITDTTRMDDEWAFTYVENLAQSGKNAEALASTKEIGVDHADSTEQPSAMRWRLRFCSSIACRSRKHPA
jgi:hypothetical protein